MTTTKKLRLIVINKQLIDLEAALAECLLSGVSSASSGQAGASQSFTRHNPNVYQERIDTLKRERSRIVNNGHRRTSPDFG